MLTTTPRTPPCCVKGGIYESDPEKQKNVWTANVWFIGDYSIFTSICYANIWIVLWQGTYSTFSFIFDGPKCYDKHYIQICGMVNLLSPIKA